MCDLVGWGMIKSSLLQDYARRFHLESPYARLMEGLWGLDHGLKEDIPAAWRSLTETSGEAARILEVMKFLFSRVLTTTNSRCECSGLEWESAEAAL